MHVARPAVSALFSLLLRRAAPGALFLALAPPVLSQASAPAAATLTIRADQPGTVINRNIYGAHNTFATPDSVRPAAFTGASLAGNRLTLTLLAKSVVVLEL